MTTSGSSAPGVHDTFGELLRRCRIAAALSQEALAERTGLSVDAIRALERGRRGTPRPDTVARLAAALDLFPDRAASAAVVEIAASEAAPRPGSSLPIAPGPLIGREQEEAAVLHLLQRQGIRLLTLTGMGGVGKTRLALAVAARVQDAYPDGVAFIDLSALSDPAQVPESVAQALGLRDAGKQHARDHLLAHLHTRRALLLLDSFEHLLDAAVLVADLVAACPHLMVLVTSRAPLHVRAEQQYRVPPLAVPISGLPDIVDLSGIASVRLFVARAQAVRPDFRLEGANMAAVAEICRRLDGLPLAIELAAARVALLPPPALLGRLEHQLALLKRVTRDLPERQQTLRATIDWSYELLVEPERVLFRRLAVFAGGCTARAVETVCNADGALDVLENLATLVDQNLLRQEAPAYPTGGDVEPRFVLLEMLREYALERLEASGEREGLRRTHALGYLAMAEAAEPELYGPANGAWMARLEREHDNIRAALAWVFERGEREIGLRLAGSLWWWWHVRGFLIEGRAVLDRLLAVGASDTVSPAVRVKALKAAGWLAHYQSDYARATALFEESLALHRAQGQESSEIDLLVTGAMEARAEGDYGRATVLLEESLARLRAEADRRSIGRGGLGLSLARLGMIRCESGDYVRATELWEECLALHRAIGDREGIAIALLGLGDVAREQGDSVRVRRLCEESLAVFRDLGEQWAIGFALNNLALAAYHDGNLERAAALAEESVRLFRALQTRSNLAEALATLGSVACARGELARSHAALSESLALAAAEGPRWIVATDLEAVAALAAARGQATSAARLLGAAAALRTTMGTPLSPARHAACLRAETLARTALGDAAYAAAWGAGQTLSPAQAIAEALNEETVGSQGKP